jgi:hypothetical protein
MAFTTYDEERFPALSKSTVISVESVLIYYVFNGRNAWHSTWVTQYTRNCMHKDFGLAQAQCERNRTQGSVFNIKELPALRISSGAGNLVISQINCETPLLGYSADAILEDVRPGQRKIDNAQDNYIRIGAPISGCALSFAYNSRFWRKRPVGNYVIILASDDPALQLEKLPRRNLVRHSSFSHGGAYKLGWRQLDSNIKKNGVTSLTKQFKQSSGNLS